MNEKKYIVVKTMLFAIFCLLSILSCTKDDDDPDMNFKFPLEVGNSWKYDYFVSVDYDSTAEENGCKDSVYYYYQTLDIITYEKITRDSIPVYNFYSTDNISDLCYCNSYYNNSGDSLICFGYYKPGDTGLDPKLNYGSLKYSFTGKEFSSIKEILQYIENGTINYISTKEDSVHYDPVTVFKYPFELKKEWVYRQSEPWRMTKKVSSIDQLETEAGKFNCWKVEYVYYDSLFDGFEFYDHIADIGMVIRTWAGAPSTVLDEYGNVLGSCTFKGRRVLTDYSLK